jgi:hypothetical protein
LHLTAHVGFIADLGFMVDAGTDIAIDKLEKPALLFGCGFLLTQKGKLIVFEDPEEFFPGNFFKPLVVGAKVETENAAWTWSRAPDSRASFSLFDPAADFIMVGGYGGLRHGILHIRLDYLG